MMDAENRQIARDSLFVLVELRLDGQDLDHRVKMRNLSGGGMMAEGSLRVTRGLGVWVNLRNIGWIEGTVAWVQESRFGIAFRNEIDPSFARAPSSGSSAQTEAMILRRPAISGAMRGDGKIRTI